MKKIILSTLAILLTQLSVGLVASAYASSSGPVELSRKEVLLNVDLSTATTRLSDAGYASPVLKVLIPELADVTVLNHRNIGEDAPCMATFQSMNPEDIIQGDPAIIQVPTTIVLEKVLHLDEQNNVCKVYLNETVTNKIRGFDFTHFRSQSVEDRHIDDCR